MENAAQCRVLWVITIVILGWCGGSAIAGDPPSSPSWVRLSGNVQVIGEYNQQQGSGAFYRYPFADRFVGRILLSARLTLFDQIQLPFQLRLTNREVGYRQPFNQFGASLQVARWLRLYGGYFSLTFSPLTFGDQRILGGGIELTPGPFYIGFLYGLGRHARLPQGTFLGEYDRWFWALKAGVQSLDGVTVLLSLMHAMDDSTSLPDTLQLPAMENLAGSLMLALPLTSVLHFRGEVAVAAFTRDLRFPETSAAESIPRWIFVPRYSTSVDGAAKVELTLNPRSWWNVRFRGEWIGPGYVTLGYTQLINDIGRITIAPTVRLLNSRLILSGSIGLQQNNLLQDKLATTQRLIGSVNLSAQLSSAISVAASYTNYGIRSNHVNDTLRVSTISQMFNFNPSFRFLTGTLRHSIAVGYSYSSVVDHNVVTAQQQQFQGHSLNIAYALQLPNNWIFTTTIFGSKNEAGENPAPSMLNISETIRVPVFKSLELLGSAGYGIQEVASQQSENFFLRFSGHYSLKPFGKLSLLFLLQSTTSENSEVQFLRGSVRYSVNW